MFLERDESHRTIEVSRLGVAGVWERRPDGVNGEELCPGGDEVGSGALDELPTYTGPSVDSIDGDEMQLARASG
jgi:hypothetical protein